MEKKKLEEVRLNYRGRFNTFKNFFTKYRKKQFRKDLNYAFNTFLSYLSGQNIDSDILERIKNSGPEFFDEPSSG